MLNPDAFVDEEQELSSPTIVLITDRTDLDDQLSSQFTNAKGFIGDNVVQSVASRDDVREEVEWNKVACSLQPSRSSMN